MSWQANAHVLKIAKDRPELSSHEVLVLLLLSACHNAHQGAAWPNLSTMATECHLSKRSVQAMLAKLEERDLIWIETRRGHRGSRALIFGFVGLDERGGEHLKAGWPQGKPRRPDADSASGFDPDQMQITTRPDADYDTDQMQMATRPDADGDMRLTVKEPEEEPEEEPEGNRKSRVRAREDDDGKSPDDDDDDTSYQWEQIRTPSGRDWMLVEERHAPTPLGGNPSPYR